MEKVIKKRNVARFQNISLLIFICIFCSSITYGQVEVPLEKRSEFTLKGDFKFVSNTILGKVSNDDGTGVFNPNESYNDGGLNNQFRMGFIDIDDDPSTFNSSSADLITESDCNAIKHVGLYWTASYADENREHDITSIKIKYPGDSSYSTISNGQVIHDYYNDPDALFKQYSCYKDITEEVLNLKNPNGTYTVANIPATTSEVNDDKVLGNGLAGGWTMIVVYQDDAKPRKRFYIYDGFVNIDSKAKPVKFSFDNFQTIPKGAVNGKIGVISYEGDKGIRGDRFQVLSNLSNSYKSITDSTNPMNNFFNANITENGRNITTRVPASQNTLGYDADLFKIKNVRNSIIGNNQSKAGFRLLTDNDGYSVMAVAFSIEIYEPAIHMIKRSLYADHSYVHPNDVVSNDQEITYSLKIYNDGNDDAKNTIIKDQLPENVVFLKESIDLPSRKIKVQYDKDSRIVNFVIPNKMVKTDSEPFEIRYNVRVNTDCDSVDENGEVLIVDRPVTAEFNGSLNETKKYSEGYNHINKCNLPDYYRIKLAVDMSGFNCPNYISIAATPKKDLDKNRKEISDSNRTNNTESAGLDEADIVKVDPPLPPANGLLTNNNINRTLRDLIDLNEIYFEFDKWDITYRAEIELNKIVELMSQDYPKMVIKIETHSDSRGNHDYNLSLSQKRAESIYQYLISKDISKNRILSYVGFGETKPVNDCLDGQDCSEDEYRKNRRSSFVIMD
ncbi:OmpA family protein [Aquimarina sp. 2201CG5-10]|uniref:OmpA family protein n=1 Tax=Aquimarina callyspongiae TaxID=3098150 RepID=UPI002AB405FE|nr:OmpA family protein [Aquimarina sp. 2201CG5-10]MDY8135766.1 OmpA family protein [Aquimarina sp. 2201CG5-10]